MPALRNQLAPNRAMSATCASVSAFATSVGAPSSPCSNGNGGLSDGFASRPESAFTSAVSSPATKRSGTVAVRRRIGRRRAPSLPDRRLDDRTLASPTRDEIATTASRAPTRDTRRRRRRARGAERPGAGRDPCRSRARPRRRSRRPTVVCLTLRRRGASLRSGRRRRRGRPGRPVRGSRSDRRAVRARRKARDGCRGTARGLLPAPPGGGMRSIARLCCRDEARKGRRGPRSSRCRCRARG